MINDMRRFWSTLFFLSIFVPFLFMLIVSLSLPSPKRNGTPLASAPVVGGVIPSPTATSPADHEFPLVAAGDGRDLWIAAPTRPSAPAPTGLLGPIAPTTNEPLFELFHRASNNGTWSLAPRKWPGVPSSMALMDPPLPPPPTTAPARTTATSATPRARATPYLLLRDGTVSRFTLESATPASSVPAGYTVKASAGGPDSLFIIALGSPAAKPAPSSPPRRTETRPATTSAPAPQTPTTPTTSTATAPATPASFAAFWFPPHGLTDRKLKPNDWSPLPNWDAPDAGPTDPSLIALAVQHHLLVLLWIDPRHSETLNVRTLDYLNPEARWSAPITTTLPAKDLGAARLFAYTLEDNVFAFWTVDLNNAVSLHGGRLASMATAPGPAGSAPPAYTVPAKNLFPVPVPLGASDTVSAATDIALGPSENSFVAVVRGRDHALSVLSLDDRGRVLSPLAAVEPRGLRHDLQIGQNIATFLVVLMFALSLWQWRQKPVIPALPAGLMVAPLHLRGLAFLIDIAIPYILTLLYFGLGDSGPFGAIFGWISLIAKPHELLKTPQPLVFLSLYVLHVAVGEIFFRKSIGKAIVGMEVLMIDGRAPTLAAIVIRSLVRIPEMVTGLALLYMLISDRQQRLGDLLARTLVVAPQPPETPPDPDKAEKPDKPDK